MYTIVSVNVTWFEHGAFPKDLMDLHADHHDHADRISERERMKDV